MTIAHYGAVPAEDDDERVKKRGGVELPMDDARPACRDPICAALFLAHLVAVLLLGIFYGSFGTYHELVEDASENEEIATRVGEIVEGIVLRVALPCAAISALLAFLFVGVVVPAAPELTVKLSVLTSLFVTAGFAAIISVKFRHWAAYVVGALLLLLALWFVWMIWNFVPFAAANLKAAAKGMTANAGTYVISAFGSIVMFAWAIGLFYVANGFWEAKEMIGTDEGCDDEAVAAAATTTTDGAKLDCVQDAKDKQVMWLILFLLLVSLFWTIAVIVNTGHVIVAGIMATWCFDKSDASGFCSNAVTSSAFRGIFYSLGSIAFGSLIEGFVKALAFVAERAKEKADSDGNKCDCDSIFMCCVTYCLRGLKDAVEFLNEWAYTYVGIYGYGYLESGKKVMELFASRGWTALVGNKLVSYVLNFTAVLIGILTGLIGIAFDNDKVGFDNHWDCFVIGFLVGGVVSHVMMNVVKGAVNTVIVCFADAPAKLESNHPALLHEMALAWVEAFPSCGVDPNSSAYDGVV